MGRLIIMEGFEMRIIQEKIESAFFDSPIFSEYFGGLKIVVADIETTGLSPARCSVILGGALTADPEGGLTAIQFFADTPEDETELLERYVKYLSRFDVVVTYNGNKFDLPFIKKRMFINKMDTAPVEALYSLDLYSVLKKHSHLPKLLPNMKQKTVEIFLGESINRTDEIDGAESVELYYKYVNGKGPQKAAALDQILLHNRDDIVGLAGIMKTLRTLDLHKIMWFQGFPVVFAEKVLLVEEINLSLKKLKIKGRVTGEVSDYICYEENFQLAVSSEKNMFNLEISCDNVNDFIVADTVALGIDSAEIRRLGGYESGYLILQDDKVIYYHEVNMLIRCILHKVLQ